MSVLSEIAHLQGRRDEVPNQLLAHKLVDRKDTIGIREIADNLWHKDKNIQADCIKVLYEVGYLDPSLITAYVDDFLKLLSSKNNRMVWGAMTALATIAPLTADALSKHVPQIQQAMQRGSVIAVDHAVSVLAAIAASNETQRKLLFPVLLKHLADCRAKEVPQHAERTLVAVNRANKDAFADLLNSRMTEFTPTQAARIRKLLRQVDVR